ncbi:MAG: hypothetical protein IKA76_00925 [Clostridia bacterium]|nr:hypothetical protein [Clostridia bacterium]
MIFLLIPLIAGILLFPYGWMLFHRHRMIKRLKITGKRLGFSWIPLRGGVLLSSNRSKQFDFALENENTVYWVKLWACYLRGTTLMIREDGRISVRHQSPKPLWKTDEDREKREAVDGKWKPVPKTVSPKIDVEGKTVIPVLLNYPTYDTVVRNHGGKMIPIRNGDTLFGKVFFTPSALEREMSQKQ